MDTLIKEHTGANDKGQSLYWAIYKDSDEDSLRPFRLIAPGSYPRRFKSLGAAEKAFKKAVAA